MSGPSAQISGISDVDPNTIFEILNKLGEGSYGTVYKALDLRDGSIVAIKVIGIEAGENWTSLQQEINILQECKNDNIVAYKGIFEDCNQYLWIVMEYCDAGSVLDLMSICNRSTLEEDVIAVLMKMSLKALDYLHKHKKIHRDIKSGNLLLTHNGVCKLADFGVSAELGNTMSKRKTLIGTPYWMAPEVLTGEFYDSKADIWSLAITAMEMATGDPPLYQIHPMKVIFQIPSLPPPTLPNPENWSAAFREFLATCLQKDPTARPTAEQLLAQSPFIRNAKSQALVAELVQASMAEIDQFRDDSELANFDNDTASEAKLEGARSAEANAQALAPPAVVGEQAWTTKLTANSKAEPRRKSAQAEAKNETIRKPAAGQAPLMHMGTVRSVVAASCNAVSTDFTGSTQLLVKGKCKTCGKPPSQHPTAPVTAQAIQQAFMQKHLKQLEDKYKGQAQRQEAEAQEAHQEQMRHLEQLKQKYVRTADRPRVSQCGSNREQQLEQLKQKYVGTNKK